MACKRPGVQVPLPPTFPESVLTPLRIFAKNSEFQIIQALKENRTKRVQLGEGFVEGIEGIKQAAAAGIQFTRLMYASGRRLSNWGRAVLDGNFDPALASFGTVQKLVELSPDLYDELCDRDEPSEFLATFRLPRRTLDTSAQRGFFLLCDRPADRGNLGSLFRSANNFGLDGVLILGHGVDPFDPKVIRASLGAVFHTPVFDAGSMEELESWLSRLRSGGRIRLIGTDSSATVGLAELGEMLGGQLEQQSAARPDVPNGDLPGGPIGSLTGGRTNVPPAAAATDSLVLVVGNEAKGMSRRLFELCDVVVAIPGIGTVNSLNAACAGSIVLWELFKTRNS